MKENTKEISNGVKIHFIGIGGIGISALAQYYLTKGHKISGSDLVSSEITDNLRKKGIKIFTPHQSKLGAGQVGKHKLPDLVIYSPAVPENNPELREAKKLGIKCQSYPQALGELTKQYFTIAVSGTHGKSTTTAMIGLLLVRAGLDPTVIVGTKLKEFDPPAGGSNCRAGKSKYLIIEADEHFAAFLNYWPKIIVITNIEADHLDYYGNLGNLKKTFNEFINHLPKDGILVKNNDDKNIKKIKYTGNTRLYSLKQLEAKKLKKFLKIPGKHNVYNALAALTVARILKIPDKISFKALSEYKGSWRRFDIRDVDVGHLHSNLHSKHEKTRKITIISDYAHHPTEIKVTLKAAREKYPGKKIWCVFQPHQYQRTYYLFADFVKAFKQTPIDKIIITDIYDVAGREEENIKKKIDSEKLVKAVNKKNVIYLPKEKILDYLRKNLLGGEVVIIMGAGDIYKLDVDLDVV